MAMPVNVKVAFHPPAASITFHGGIKPFAEAVTRGSAGATAFALYPDAALGGLLTTQIELVDRGGADAAFVIKSIIAIPRESSAMGRKRHWAIA